jgi:3-deoxy-D-manno-octulosonic acid (KDO) 8-phosphate synthase
MRKAFDIDGIPVGGGAPLLVIAGPCALESQSVAETVCGRM